MILIMIPFCFWVIVTVARMHESFQSTCELHLVLEMCAVLGAIRRYVVNQCCRIQ